VERAPGIPGILLSESVLSRSSFYSGSVASVIFESDDFRILRVVVDGDNKKLPITVKGNFPAQNVKIGSWVAFEGKWKEDERYGRQLVVVRSPVQIHDWSDERVLASLAANGVGPSVRLSLQEFARNKRSSLFDLLEGEDLGAVPGLEEFTILHTRSRWQNLRTNIDALGFMSEMGLPASVVSKIWKTFGSDLERIVREDPWILVRVAGVSFKETDEIALRLGVSIDNPGRVRGAVLAAVQEIVNEGNVFATTGQVSSWIRRAIPGKGSVSHSAIAEAIRDLAKDSMVNLDRTNPNISAVYDSWHYEIEETSSALLVDRLDTGVNEKYLREGYAKVGGRVEDAEKSGATLKTKNLLRI